MKHRLVQEQTLQRKMNQSLIQAIHLLQYSGAELNEYIKQIAEENPLIEEVKYDDITSFRTENVDQVSIGEINPIKLSMYEQLKQQLYTLDIPDTLEPTVIYGIDSLNEDGYLDTDVAVWAEQCQTTEKKVIEALGMIQSLEPAGIGARTFTECIYLQLKDQSVYRPFIQELLEEHLEWIATEDIAAIIDTYDTTEEVVESIITQIKLCHPKPGHLLEEKTPEYIIPEANIFEEDGTWKISFYKWNTPTITISDAYESLSGLEKGTDQYLQEKYRQIDWLQQAITYRANTLELVIRKIVEKQQQFFEHGPLMLQPLTLKDIATELHVHLSTVSRTISNKYVQTKDGVIPLKFFMQTGISKQGGKQTASFVVKRRIVELIENEDKAKPLSDQKIVNHLYAEFKIKIARRTVMKYRDELNIRSSTKRK